jgi:2-polyprenyl-3-methyl-5-hydroxy-6-metoxy-1,4-benzoquinol methylase
MTQLDVDHDPDLQFVLAELRRAVRDTSLAQPTASPERLDTPIVMLGRTANALEELNRHSVLRMHALPARVPVVGKLIARLQEHVGRMLGSTWRIYNLLLQQNTVNDLLVEVVRDLSRTVAIHEGHLRTIEAEHSASLMQRDARLRDAESRLVVLQNALLDTDARLGEAYSRLARLRQELSQKDAARIEMDVALDDLRDELGPRLAALERMQRMERQPTVVSAPPVPATADASIDYFSFELRFRGSRKLVRERQRMYLDVFSGGGDILDIGCGRGEFLELMLEQGARPRGIELSSQMVSFCQAQGLPVEQADAISYLQNLEDDSLDGVFCAQVIEHIDLASLVRLLDLCHAKLRVGAPIVLETPNPLCLSIYTSSFYLDPTHTKPVHPGTLQFMLEQAGFWETEIRFSSSVPDSVRLSELTDSEAMQPSWMEAANQNTRKLNDLLFGYMDYAAVARKLAWPAAASGTSNGQHPEV